MSKSRLFLNSNNAIVTTGGEDMACTRFQDPTLQVRSTRRGDEYYIRYRENTPKGQKRSQRNHAIGLVKDMTRRTAERRKAEFMQKINGDVYRVPAMMPFGEIVREFRARHILRLAVPTQRNYDQWLRLYVEPAFAQKRLGDITQEDIQAFLDGLKGRHGPLAPTTRRSIRGLLASVWALAEQRGYWNEKRPFPKATTGRRGRGPQRVRERVIYTPTQIKRILAALRGDVKYPRKGQDTALIIETLHWTGMAISECLGLRARVFDLDAAVPVVRVERRFCRGDDGATKTVYRQRVLPLGYLADVFRERIAGMMPDDYVFTNDDGRPYTDCTLLCNYLTKVLQRLGLKRLGTGWHAFRRTSLTDMGQEPDINLFDLQDQAGHASLEMTREYYLAPLRRRAEAVKRMQERFVGLTRGSVV